LTSPEKARVDLSDVEYRQHKHHLFDDIRQIHLKGQTRGKILSELCQIEIHCGFTDCIELCQTDEYDVI
jgi:hypothetical protein